MSRRIILALIALTSLISADKAKAVRASVLIDFDPKSAEQTVIVESIAADDRGNLNACDRIGGTVWRIDPKNPKLVVVRRVQECDIGRKKVRADVSGIVFNQAGALYLTAGGFKEALRIRSRNLAPENPGIAQTFAIETEGPDGPAFDPQGNLWVAANERNAVVLVQPDGRVFDAQKNGSKGPLEFPTSMVFVDANAYVSNFDTARRDNLAAEGKTSIDGIGASIIRIEP